MKSRLRRELHDFLVKHDISLETPIVTHFMLEIMGVAVPRDKEGKVELEEHYGLKLNDERYGRGDEGDTVIFYPKKFSLTSLEKLWSYIEFPRDKWTTDNYQYEISGKLLLIKFLPMFKRYFEQQCVENPEIIAEYRVKSKAILEATAISTLQKYTEKAVEIVLGDQTEESKAIKNTIKAMFVIKGMLSELRRRPILYKEIISSTDEIKALMATQDVANNKELTAQLKLVLEGIAMYTRYHRNESVFANKYFVRDMEKYLNGMQITSGCSDVIEETLLKLAGVKLGAHGKSKMKIGEDQSRCVFDFEDISKENTKKLVTYIRDMGDETVTEGHGYSKDGSAVSSHVGLEALSAPASMMMMDYQDAPKIKIECHSIEVDGKFLYDVLMPEMQNELQVMKAINPASLDSYIAKSKIHFDKLAKDEANKVTANKNTLFAVSSSSSDKEDSMDVVYQSDNDNGYEFTMS